MQPKTILRWLFLVLNIVPLAAAGASGCSGDSSNNPSGTGGHASGSSTGSTGSSSSSGGVIGWHQDGGTCSNIGASCSAASECCTQACTGGVCNLGACTSDGQKCGGNAECCSGTCGGGTCTPLNTTCKTLNNACMSGGECCSGLCSGGICSASSFCDQVGDVCQLGLDCCTGICNVAQGNVLGTCGPPISGPANCKFVDGVLCGGISADGGVIASDGGIPACGGECCSRLCAPYGPTGVLVCQPATGCHVVGDLCTQDQDCCGSKGLPGQPNKPVTCEMMPGYSVGVCRNPIGCKPDGDVCKLATMSCNASCDCCSGNCENQDTCHTDQVGVPRCGPAKCVDPNGACASGADCCNGMPCVPNPGGNPPFICSMNSCVPSCGACAVNADCCPGETCETAPGSTMGTCGPCGGMDGGTKDGGGSSSSSTGGGTDGGGVCSTYGQQCSTNGDCCNGVPCNSAGGACMPGMTGCTCHDLVF